MPNWFGPDLVMEPGLADKAAEFLAQRIPVRSSTGGPVRAGPTARRQRFQGDHCRMNCLRGRRLSSPPPDDAHTLGHGRVGPAGKKYRDDAPDRRGGKESGTNSGILKTFPLLIWGRRERPHCRRPCRTFLFPRPLKSRCTGRTVTRPRQERRRRPYPQGSGVGHALHL